jgi:hypothetical protein
MLFDGKRQELCLCIIEEGNDPVNKKTGPKNHTTRGYFRETGKTPHTHDNSWHVICAGYKSP